MSQRFSKELPKDVGGHKTTAIPREELAGSEWVTPVADQAVLTEAQYTTSGIRELNTKALQMNANILANKEATDQVNANIGLLLNKMDSVQSTLNQIVSLLDLTVKETFSGSVTYRHDFQEPMRSFVIVNDGEEALSFVINGQTMTVAAKEALEETFDPFTFVIVNTTVPYRAYGRG